MGAWVDKWADLPFVTKRARSGCIDFLDVPLAFDIETSYHDVNEAGGTPDRVSWMYHWQVACGSDAPRCVFGREWGTFKDLLRSLVKMWNLGETRKAIFFVHNLGYEFSFLAGEFEFSSVFARKIHDPIEVELDGEFLGVVLRCTYALWGTSLQKAAEDTPYKKGKDLDHSITRFSDTPLTRKERLYCRNDVRSICYKIAQEREQYGHIHAIPLTKTGKVRRVCRKEFGRDRLTRCLFKETRLDSEQYDMHLRAFIGGDVHCNAWAHGETLHVHCKDLTSDYPARMCFSKYPAGRGRLSRDPREYERARRLGLPYIVEYRVNGARCQQFPSCMKAHCRDVLRPVIDNGRIVKADSFTQCVTDIDDDIFRKNYEFESVELIRVYVYPFYRYLPNAWRNTVLDFFYKKNTLKGVSGSETEYRLSKENLNSIYGMTVSRIVRDNVVWTGAEWDIEEDSGCVDDYYDNPLSFLPYHIGVWVTAHARWELYRALWAVGKHDAVYWDTDSCKYVGDHEKEFERLNREIATEARRSGLPRDKWDICGHALGLWDDEGECDFKAFGAKKYATFDGVFTTTIAGLGKSAAEYIEQQGGFDALQYGFEIPAEYSGRTYSQYYCGEERRILVKGRVITTRAYCSIIPTTYTLGASADYLKFLKIVKGEAWYAKSIH